MNVHMWQDDATRENLATLVSRGVTLVEPVEGMLACGYEGAGKLADVDVIANEVMRQVERVRSLEGTVMLVTAGPTHEPIDPVRYIANRSSGITGYEIAREAALRGAEVYLVHGPTDLPVPFGVRDIPVTTAAQMLHACEAVFGSCDVAVFAAAVADYRVEHPAGDKIKKAGEGALTLRLIENPDVLATLAAHKGDTFVVGFAAETSQVLDHARAKLARKNADLIVANDVSDPSMGFGTACNKVWLVSKDGTDELPVATKRAIAGELLDRIARR